MTNLTEHNNNFPKREPLRYDFGFCPAELELVISWGNKYGWDAHEDIHVWINRFCEQPNPANNEASEEVLKEVYSVKEDALIGVELQHIYKCPCSKSVTVIYGVRQ